MPCPICQSKKTPLFSEDKYRQYFQCQNCEFIFANRASTLDEKTEKLRYDQHQNTPNNPGYKNFLNKLVQPVLEKAKPNSTGLDFGSGPEPVMASMLKEHGHQIEIYDKHYANHPENLEKKYDFITMSEVIEHLENPQKVTRKLIKQLNPGGFLAIMTTPYTNQINFKNWHYKNDDTHISFFTLKTLKTLAKQNNCHLEQISDSVFILTPITKVKHNKLIILLSLLIFPPFAILLSHQFLPSNYFFSSLYKLIFLFPIFYRIYLEKKSLKQSLQKHFSLRTFKKNILKMTGLGILLSSVYLTSFFLFQDKIDTASIITKINDAASINLSNIIVIGLYIIIVNSLLEEFFWRGFIFKELKNTTKPYLAYLLSATAFSFHHVIFYCSWFSPPFFLIITIGLIGYALIMNFIFQKYKDLFSCWLVHIFADIAQIYIAYQIFSSI